MLVDNSDGNLPDRRADALHGRHRARTDGHQPQDRSRGPGWPKARRSPNWRATSRSLNSSRPATAPCGRSSAQRRRRQALRARPSSDRDLGRQPQASGAKGPPRRRWPHRTAEGRGRPAGVDPPGHQAGPGGGPGPWITDIEATGPGSRVSGDDVSALSYASARREGRFALLRQSIHRSSPA